MTGGDASRERPSEASPGVGGGEVTGDVARWPQVDRFIRPNRPVKMDGPGPCQPQPSLPFFIQLANRVCGPKGFLG